MVADAYRLSAARDLKSPNRPHAVTKTFDFALACGCGARKLAIRAWVATNSGTAEVWYILRACYPDQPRSRRPCVSAPVALVAGCLIANKCGCKRQIGADRMGMVVAIHPGLQQRVAIKFLDPAALTYADFVARFEREARACGYEAHGTGVGCGCARDRCTLHGHEYLEGHKYIEVMTSRRIPRPVPCSRSKRRGRLRTAGV